MSKKNDGGWRSLDELKAIYIADIQSYTRNGDLGKPSKITMGGKEVWKVPVHYFHESNPKLAYVYVDVVTGKSKNDYDYDFFNNASNPDNWFTLKEVDVIIDKKEKAYDDYPDPTPFKDVLRNLYPESDFLINIFSFRIFTGWNEKIIKLN